MIHYRRRCIPADDVARRVAALIRLLSEQRWDARTAVMDLLGSCGSAAKDAVPELEKALSDPEFKIRMGAVSALGYIGSPGSIP